MGSECTIYRTEILILMLLGAYVLDSFDEKKQAFILLSHHQEFLDIAALLWLVSGAPAHYRNVIVLQTINSHVKILDASRVTGELVIGRLTYIHTHISVPSFLDRHKFKIRSTYDISYNQTNGI